MYGLIPLGMQFMTQYLMLVEKRADGSVDYPPDCACRLRPADRRSLKIPPGPPFFVYIRSHVKAEAGEDH